MALEIILGKSTSTLRDCAQAQCDAIMGQEHLLLNNLDAVTTVWDKREFVCTEIRCAKADGSRTDKWFVMHFLY